MTYRDNVIPQSQIYQTGTYLTLNRAPQPDDKNNSINREWMSNQSIIESYFNKLIEAKRNNKQWLN